jgi:uncharacterized membrane protein YbhN (UPF0104 family)
VDDKKKRKAKQHITYSGITSEPFSLTSSSTAAPTSVDSIFGRERTLESPPKITVSTSFSDTDSFLASNIILNIAFLFINFIPSVVNPVKRKEKEMKRKGVEQLNKQNKQKL